MNMTILLLALVFLFLLGFFIGLSAERASLHRGARERLAAARERHHRALADLAEARATETRRRMDQ